MECIFCKQDSTNSLSVEHIVPNSFGNNTAVLRKGIVCDKCNNYFARKVEQPFLESEAIRKLRQELGIENKRGKTISDYSYPRVGKEYVKQINTNRYHVYTHDTLTEEEIAEKVSEYQKYLAETDKILLEQNIYTSRLLAKMALEYFVYRCDCLDDVCKYVSKDPVFKDIRSYARYGSRKIWTYSARRIYARNEAYRGDPFSAINWEADYMFLGNGEVYFIIAMFGIEYAICINHPLVDGYKDWLSKNNWISPLYLPEDIRKELFDQYTKKFDDMNEADTKTATKGEKK